MRYDFRDVSGCNMCGHPTAQHRLVGRRLNRSQGLRPWRRGGVTVSVFRCTQCGLIYANPQPVPVSLQDHYGVPPEQYWQPEYFEVHPDHFAAELRTLGALLPGSQRTRALDIGAGIGKCMIALEAAGYEAHGIEASAPFHERAIARMGVSPERLRLGMIEEVDFPPGHFDFITFGAVLEHLYDPDAALRRALGWLSPGGLVHIEVPSSDWLIHRLINRYYRLRGSDYCGNLSPMHEPYHLYEFTLASFRRHGARAGYAVAHHEHYVCTTYLPPVIDPIARRWMKRTGTGMQLCVWLRKAG